MKFEQINFAKQTSIRIGGIVNVAIIESADEFKNFNNYKIIGGGNNLLVSENPETKLMMLSKNFDYIYLENNILRVGGATPNGKIFNFAKKNNLTGFEFLQNIPSRLGGLIKMNAGMKNYEIANIIHSVSTLSGKKNRADINFKYRFSGIDEPIIEAEFIANNFGFSHELVELFKNMRSNQPKEPSAGSLFKNPEGYSAGKLIDEVGLKGFRIGDMAWSNIHANFLINLGGGKFHEAIELINLAETRVFDKFGVKLTREVCIVL